MASQRGFPIELLTRVLCTRDGEPLRLDPHFEPGGLPDTVARGTLRCVHCAAAYSISRGILRLLDDMAMDAESAHEQRHRDEMGYTVSAPSCPHSRASNEMEMLSTLEAIPNGNPPEILEVGCGEGRYTLELDARASCLLAVDFSFALLEKLDGRLPTDSRAGLVHADVTTLKVRHGGFDVVFSTLTSNLPSREHRDKLYALACHALKQSGRFIFSTHHHGIRQWLARESKSGRYWSGGIYRYNFHLAECREEPAPYFGRIDARPIQIHLPLARTLGLPVVKLSRWIERIPVLNRFGMLVLGIAEQPRAAMRRVANSRPMLGMVGFVTEWQTEIGLLAELI